MTTTIKMTNRSALTYCMDNFDLPADVRERLTAMLASLDKKASYKSDKPSAKSLEGVAFRQNLLAVLADFGHPVSIPDLLASGMFPEDTTSGKVSAHLTILKKDGKVVRTEVKRVAYFELAGEEVAGE